MNEKQPKAMIKKGEDSTCQFKADIRNIDSLASEMAAFTNSEGGSILIGVHDDGSTPGLTRADVARINQMIGNAASQHVKSPLHVRTENGVIWLKCGADKRRINSKEELRRLSRYRASSMQTLFPPGPGLKNWTGSGFVIF